MEGNEHPREVYLVKISFNLWNHENQWRENFPYIAYQVFTKGQIKFCPFVKNGLGRPPFFTKRQFNLYPYAQLSADVVVHTELVILSTRWWSKMAHLFAVCYGSSSAFQRLLRVFVRGNAATRPGRHLKNWSVALPRVFEVPSSS